MRASPVLHLRVEENSMNSFACCQGATSAMLIKSSSRIALVCNAKKVGWLLIQLQRSTQKDGNGSGDERDGHTDISNTSRSGMIHDARCGRGAGRRSRSGSSTAAGNPAARRSSRARGNDIGADDCGGSWGFRIHADQRLGDGVGVGRSGGICGDKLGRSQAKYGRDNGVDLHIDGMNRRVYKHLGDWCCARDSARFVCIN